MAARKRSKPSSKNPWPERVKALRRKLGAHGKRLTQAELAARLDVSIRTVLGWERGERVPVRPAALLINLLLC